MLDKDRSPDAMAARDAAIIGQPPRVAPMTEAERTDEVRDIVCRLQIAAGIEPDGKIPDVMAITLKHPTLYMKGLEYAMVLMSGGALSPRDRELAVLRVGWLARAPFEWGEHVVMGKRNAGLSAADVARVIDGPGAPDWSEHDRAVIQAVDDLIGDAMIAEETWAVLARTYDDRQLMELPLLIGQYLATAFLQNSIRAPLMPGGAGLAAR